MSTKKQTAEKWLGITKKALVESLAKEGVGGSGELAGSIVGRVNGKGQDATSIELYYKFYGKFVDMGVGKKATQGGFGKRTAKEWYSSVMPRRLAELDQIMAKVAGAEMIITIRNGLPGDMEINL